MTNSMNGNRVNQDDDHNEVTIEIGSMNPKDVSDTILENQKLRELIDIEIIKCGKMILMDNLVIVSNVN